MFTNKVFQSSSIEINYNSESDFFSVIAKEDLPAGHLVFVEHILFGDMLTLLKGVSKDKKFITLYPRNKNDVNEKVKMNMFAFGDEYVIGDIASKFNHSCAPNCHFDIIDAVIVDVKLGMEAKFYGTWTLYPVKKSEELTFDYVNIGDKDYHDKMKKVHNFSCECSEEYIIGNEKRGDEHATMSNTFCKRDKVFITSIIDDYLESRLAITTNILQHRIRN